MFLRVAAVLTPAELRTITALLTKGQFVDGKLTAGMQAQRVKQNLQLAANNEHQIQLQTLLMDALLRHELIRQSSFPRHIFSILFSKYESGMAYGNHVDNPLFQMEELRRADLSITVFLSPPETYEGGELAIASPVGLLQIKLAAGDGFIYPSTYIHQVKPVTQGVRLAAVAWIQSSIRDMAQRELLYELGIATRSVTQQLPESQAEALLSKTYANLLRMWAEI